MKALFVITTLLSLSPLAQAELSSQGEIRLESRVFTDDDDDSTKDGNFALGSRLEVQNEKGNFAQRLQVFSRVDRQDESRNVFILEEAYLSYAPGNFEFKAGSQVLNWSATEAFHPADIINSRNFDSDFENAEKMGEPMVSAAYLLDSGAITLYYMPMLTRPISPASSNRLSFLSSGFSVTESSWVEEDGVTSTDEYHPQFAAKFDYSFDSIDLSFHAVDHIDRSQPAFQVLSASKIGVYFLPVTQLGATLQGAFGPWVLKLEYAHRDFDDLPSLGTLAQPDHEQLAVGVEYGWEHGSGKDSTIILEGQRMMGLTKDERAAISTFQSDVLLGYRLAFNDVYGQEVFVSAISDTERSHEYLFNLSYKRRLTDVWSVSTGLRAVDAPVKETTAVGLESLDESNQYYLNISRHF